MDNYALNHNWRTPLSVRAEWQTAIHTSVNGGESRSALRRYPKVYFSYHVSDRLSYFEMRQLAQADGFIVPLWWVSSRLRQSTGFGDDDMFFSDDYLGVPPYVWVDGDFYKVNTATSSPRKLVISGLLRPTLAGTKIYAAYPVKVMDSPATTFYSGTASETKQLSMMVLGEYYCPRGMAKSDVQDLFSAKQPNKSSPDSSTSEGLFSDFLAAGGADNRLGLASRSRESHSFSYLLKDQAEGHEMWEALGRLGGRMEAISLPTWRVLPLIRSYGNTLEFEHTPGVFEALDSTALWILERDGTTATALTNYPSISGDVVSVDSALPLAKEYTPDMAVIMRRAQSARLSSDTVEFLYHTPYVTEIQLGFTEV